MTRSNTEESLKDLAVYRRLLAIGGAIYFSWWFMVEFVLPGEFNPLMSRMVVVGIMFTLYGLGFCSRWVQHHIHALFIACTWMITAHYFYLFYHNAGDFNWVVGCFITVIAIDLCMHTNSALLAYSAFVIALSTGLTFAHPALEKSVFLPGIITILVQANLGLRSRVNTMKHLKDSNKRFQLLFHSTFEGILVHEQGTILNVNESLCKILGYAPKELIGKSVKDIIHPSERVKVNEKLKLSEVTPYETIGLGKQGDLVDIEVRAKNFIYDDRPARLVTTLDIRDRKKAEQERIAAHALIENVRVRDEFISIASHELKTPISALKLQTQLIERDIEKNASTPQASPNEKLKVAVEMFHRQIDRLTELVESMLDVSKISAGRFSLKLTCIDLTALVRETIALQFPAKPSPAISIEGNERLLVRTDRRRFEQVIVNLLNNAIKYGEGKPIQVKVFGVDGFATLSVADQGIGISPEFLPKIFERFERAVSARNISGLGLGLFITRQIVEAHGGSIKAESTAGSGSVFTVRLPLI